MRPVLIATLLLGLGLGVSACDSADSADSADDASMARLTVRLTDAPFPFDLAEAAEVTITRIELLAADADTTDSTAAALDPILLYDGDPFVLNLLDLRDGVDTLLVERFAIPADGSYDQIRLYVGEDAEVRFLDGRVFPLALPSADRSGIKVFLPEYDATGADGDLDLLIDFDVERSFVTRGDPESETFRGFLFKPILAVESLTVDGVPADTSGTKG